MQTESSSKNYSVATHPSNIHSAAHPLGVLAVEAVRGSIQHAGPTYNLAAVAAGFSKELASISSLARAAVARVLGLEDSTLRTMEPVLHEAKASGIGVPEVWEYSSAKVADLAKLPSGWDGEGSPALSKNACRRLLRLLRAVTQDGTVYPKIVMDFEGGLSAEWRAGKQSVAIEVDHSGAAFVYATSLSGEQILAESLNPDQSAYPKVRAIRNELAAMSARVTAVNPSWRSLFE